LPPRRQERARLPSDEWRQAGSQLPTQPRLLNEAVLGILLLTQEPRLLPAAGHKGLQGGSELETQKPERRKPRGRDTWYLASWGDNITQYAHCVVQGPKRGRDPHVDAFPLHLLYGIIEGEECQCRVPPIRPPEQGASPCLQVTVPPNQGLGRPYADTRRCRPLLRQHLLRNSPLDGSRGGWHGHGHLPCHHVLHRCLGHASFHLSCVNDVSSHDVTAAPDHSVSIASTSTSV
jgi:hypothetical protein